MVFGWGKKKQQDASPPPETPQRKEITLSEISQTVIDLENLRTSQTLNEIKTLRNTTQPLIDDLIKIGNVLDDDDLKIDDIDKHLAIIVVRGKKQVIDVIKKDVNALPEVSSIDDIAKLNSSLNQILKKVGDVLGRQTRVIHIFAKKYATRLKEILEVMNANHTEIRELIKNYEYTKSTSVEISDLLNQIKTSHDVKLETAQKITKMRENLNSLDDQIAGINISIEKTKSSDGYKKYSALKNTLDSFVSTETKIKHSVNEQFAKISRPLSRYEYGSSLDKSQKNVLSKLVAEPFDVLLPENKDTIIIILENVRKAISSGSISVKDVDKSMSYITETEESLDVFLKQKSEYDITYQKMSRDLADLFSSELSALENELTKTTSLKNGSQTKIQQLEDEVSEINSKIPQLVSEIEDKLRRFSNTKYTVLVD